MGDESGTMGASPLGVLDALFGLDLTVVRQ